MADVTDNFNRANETPLSGGGVWTNDSASAAFTFNLSANTAVPNSVASDAYAWYTGATWDADQGAEANISCTSTLGGGQGVGVLLRKAAAAGTRTCYRIVADHNATLNVEISKILAGTFQSVFQTQFTRAWTNGDLLTATVEGPTNNALIKVYINGVLVGTKLDTVGDIPASGFPGLCHSSTTVAPSIDNWRGFSPVSFSPIVMAPPTH